MTHTFCQFSQLFIQSIIVCHVCCAETVKLFLLHSTGIIWKKKTSRPDNFLSTKFYPCWQVHTKCRLLFCDFIFRYFVWVAFVQGLVVPTLDIPSHGINNYPRQKYSVWPRVRHCGIASVWAKMSPSNPCPGSFWRPSTCFKRKRNRKI